MQTLQTLNKNYTNLPISTNKGLIQILNNFLSLYESRNTQKTYKRIIENYFRFLKVAYLEDFRRFLFEDLVGFTTDFINTYSNTNSKRIVYSCLKSFWAYLVDVRKVSKNPVIKKRFPAKQIKSSTPSMGFDELKQLLQKLDSYKDLGYTDYLTYCIVLTLSTTGLRISEMLQITLDMVEQGTINVRQKRGRMRELDLPKETQQELLNFAGKNSISDYLFKTKRGKLCSRSYAFQLIKKATNYKYTCHSFRKAVIEILIKQGVHINEVAKVSGHSDINMLFYYDNTKDKAVVHCGLAELLCGEAILKH